MSLHCSGDLGGIACVAMPDLTELALQSGYLGLFLFTFAASTLITAPADVVAMAMPPLGFNPFIVGGVGTIAGYLGNLVNYMVGRYGTQFVLSRWLQPPDNDDQHWTYRAQRLYKRGGAYTLLLSAVPFIGDPLTAIAGGFRLNLVVFTVLVLFSKVVKYTLLLGLIATVSQT